MLSVLAISVVLASCSNQAVQEKVTLIGATKDTLPVHEQYAPTPTSNKSCIIYKEDFEGNAPFAKLYKQFSTSYGFGASSDQAYEGNKSGRFELRDTDPMTSKGTRSEVLFPEQSNPNRWYAFSVYFPSADYEKDAYPELITQWHQGRGTSPCMALQVIKDRYRLVIANYASATGSSQKIDFGTVKKDSWNRFVFHIIHSSDSDGLVEIWLNGNKIYTLNGKNMGSLTTMSLPRWKLGIYKWKWNEEETTDTKLRVLYFDDIRIGNENANYGDLATSSLIEFNTPSNAKAH